ncbi:MAG: M28 family peptidase [Planctomycetia bacterium]|nr:M28 family peptidase [Planctomycetia bacterium]
MLPTQIFTLSLETTRSVCRPLGHVIGEGAPSYFGGWLRACIFFLNLAFLCGISCGERCPTVAPPAREDAVPCAPCSILLPGGMGEGDLEQFLQNVSQDNLREYAHTLCAPDFAGRGFGTPGGKRAAEFILGKLREFGYSNAAFVPVPSGVYEGVDKEGQNIEALWFGTDPQPGASPEKYLIFCAHYDHVGESATQSGVYYPGADDNASSVAILLEIARVLQMLPAGEPKTAVLFLFFDGEELGLLGSRYWVGKPTIPREKIVAVVNLEMNGGLDERHGLYFFGTTTGTNLKEWAQWCNLRENPLRLKFPFSALLRSDHAVFPHFDIPVLMVASSCPAVYHTPKDTADRLNYEGMEKITKCALKLAIGGAYADGRFSTLHKDWRAKSRNPQQDEVILKDFFHTEEKIPL